MKRRHPSLAVLVLGLVLPLLLFTVCGDDNPSTKPGDSGAEHLAGGGRNQGDDPFGGGPDGSGPTRPDFEYPDPGLIPLFYSEIDCGESPGQLVISNQEDWNAWWTAATACYDNGGGVSTGDGDEPSHPRLRDDSIARGPLDRNLATIDRLRSTARRVARTGEVPSGIALGDSGDAEPDTLFPWPGDPPVIDFAQNVVVVIRLAPEDAYGRGVWVTEVITSETGTVVRYQVSSLGDDCFGGRDSIGSFMSSPTIAVMVPRPFNDPVRWEREDIVFDCSWEPDPDQPLAIYYTDADCDLGAGEVVFRDAQTFEAWLDQAFACDQARWGQYDSTIVVPGTGTGPRPRFGDGDRDSVPGDPVPPPPPPSWIGIDVDFTKYAVLILRAGSQTRWGGGVWLDAINTTESGTTIDYTVMEPIGDCPPIETGEILRPTVAIRVLLPIGDSVTWNRRTESIECGWRDGGPDGGTGTGTDSLPPPRPL
jgi:hypothetical protein